MAYYNGNEILGLQANIADGEEPFRFDEMPPASNSYYGKIVEFIGATTANYTQGYFYKCIRSGTSPSYTYSWEQINVQPQQDISGKQDKFGEVTKNTSNSSVTVKLEGDTFVFSDKNGNSVMAIPLTAYLQFIKGVVFNDVIFNNAVNLPLGSKINNHDISPASVIRRVQNESIGIDTIISNGETLVCNGYSPSVSVTLSTPVISDTPDEYLCGVVFTPASGNFTFSDSVSGDYTIVWEEEPAWTAGKVYEISYRCLWIFGTDGKIIISAKCSELTLPEASSS